MVFSWLSNIELEGIAVSECEFDKTLKSRTESSFTARVYQALA
jgi:hypothetical protein